jgi:hypothetical protein
VRGNGTLAPPSHRLSRDVCQQVLVLRLPGSDQDLDLTQPVGAVVPKGTCSVTVDLVHTVRPQG